jgi:tetratricopeptide (TPR) repeat protein
MNSLHQSISLNNEGVALLQNGDNRAAVGRLTEALSISKIELGYLQDNPSVSMNSFNNETHHASLVHSSTPLRGLHDENYFIFNQALTLSALTDVVSYAHTLQACCASIILNLALAYHRQARLGNRICLIKAMKLYKMALRLSWNAPITETTLTVRVAAANNMAQISLEQGDYKKARQELEGVAYLIRFPGLEEDLRSGLLLNVLMVKDAPYAASAA